MQRARVFVLREKQNEVLSKVKEIFEQYLDRDEQNDPLNLDKTKKELEDAFQIKFDDGDDLPDQLGESDYHVAALVARKMLDKNPPDTKPPWFSPWNN
jgi:hypothetical protein